jgi:chromate reductase, NAD(P)H dehydrogenase (quinone)
MSNPSNLKPLPTVNLSKQMSDFTSEGAPPPGMVSGSVLAQYELQDDTLDVVTEAKKSVQIAVIVGSIRRDSYNLKLAKAIEKIAPVEFLFMHVDIATLPQYNQDEDDKDDEFVARFKAVISSAQAILFVTPEYNRSIPGVLKNAIDHGSRPYGQGIWAGKPTAIIGASIGVTGTAMAQQHLRNILAYLDVPVMGQPEAFMHVREGFLDENGDFGKATGKFMANWVDEFSSWVTSHLSKKHSATLL